jgi:aryl-alcohol dehydrogenase
MLRLHFAPQAAYKNFILGRESMVVKAANSMRAAVVREKGGPFIIEQLQLEEPRDDEVLVRIVATGMCHTDMVVRDQVYPVPLPIVLGHEGAGVVEHIRSSVGGPSNGSSAVTAGIRPAEGRNP